MSEKNAGKRPPVKAAALVNPRDPKTRRAMFEGALKDPRWMVTLEYDGPLNPEVERMVRRVAPRPSDGSGYCFVTNKRDHSWHYRQYPAAQACRRRVTKAMMRYETHHRRLNWSVDLSDEHEHALRELKKLERLEGS